MLLVDFLQNSYPTHHRFFTINCCFCLTDAPFIQPVVSSAAAVSNAPSIYPVVFGTAFPPVKPVGVARTVLVLDTTDAHVQPVCVATTVPLVEYVGVTTVASVTTAATVQPVGVARNVLPAKLVVFCMDCCSCYD
jgi:hypothetical protein